jgi:hypothetical protein
MSWQIPTQIEQDIIAGKAQYRTYQTGVGGQSILPVPPNAYAVIFGYDFSPAGGGLRTDTLVGGSTFLTSDVIRPFETQQISFYTGADFFPFVHHVNTTQAAWRDPVLGFAVDVVGIDQMIIFCAKFLKFCIQKINSSSKPKSKVFTFFFEGKNLLFGQEFEQVLGIGSHSASLNFKGLLLHCSWNEHRKIAFFWFD